MEYIRTITNGEQFIAIGKVGFYEFKAVKEFGWTEFFINGEQVERRNLEGFERETMNVVFKAGCRAVIEKKRKISQQQKEEIQ